MAGLRISKKAGQSKNASAAPAPPHRTTKAKPSRTRGLNRPVEVEVRIDRSLKRQWDEAVARVAGAKREGAGAFDELWETIGHIIEHEPPLYLAGGFSSAKQFLREHVGENERTAQRLIRVAKYASPAEEAKYGVSKLDAALSYIEANTGGTAKGRVPVDFAKLRIAVARDKTTSRIPLDIPLEETSVEELRAAARKLHSTKDSPRASVSPEARAITNVLQAAGLEKIKVRIARGTVSLSAIPLATFAQLARALAKVKLPTPPV